jgi:hypothetical protein
MSHAADLSSTDPTPSRQTFRAQMEGLAMTLLYAVAFVWMHLASGRPTIDPIVLGAFFAGLFAIPLLVAMPLVMLRRLLFDTLRRHAGVAAFLPLAGFAFYGLQMVLVWVATREAYSWVMTRGPIA